LENILIFSRCLLICEIFNHIFSGKMGCVMDSFDEASDDIKTEHTVRKLGDPRVVVEDGKIKLLS
jgi:hypothetical protein